MKVLAVMATAAWLLEAAAWLKEQLSGGHDGSNREENG